MTAVPLAVTLVMNCDRVIRIKRLINVILFLYADDLMSIIDTFIFLILMDF